MQVCLFYILFKSQTFLLVGSTYSISILHNVSKSPYFSQYVKIDNLKDYSIIRHKGEKFSHKSKIPRANYKPLFYIIHNLSLAIPLNCVLLLLFYFFVPLKIVSIMQKWCNKKIYTHNIVQSIQVNVDKKGVGTCSSMYTVKKL